MNASINITAYCAVVNNCVYVNDKLLFTSDADSYLAFIEQAYKHFEINYPKFYKMDALSKLGFLTSELLFKENFNRENYNDFDIGIVLSNKHSSLDVDAKYYKQVQNNIASPALFVYTLPNIVIGEICIRQKIKGENNFFIADEYNAIFVSNYVNNLIETGVIKSCIAGWVDVLNTNYQSLLYLVEKSETNSSGFKEQSTPETIFNLFQKHNIPCRN